MQGRDPDHQEGPRAGLRRVSERCASPKQHLYSFPSSLTCFPSPHRYARLGLARVGLPPGLGLDPERVEAMLKQQARVVVFFSLSLLLAPVVETLVLLDRMIYLQENGELSPPPPPNSTPPAQALCLPLQVWTASWFPFSTPIFPQEILCWWVRNGGENVQTDGICSKFVSDSAAARTRVGFSVFALWVLDMF